MSLNARDELARIIDEHEWSRHLGGSRGEQIADILIEHGWRKVDPGAETFEYGVRRDHKYGGTVAEMANRSQAESISENWGAATAVVRRRVIRGPWEVEQ